MKQKPCGSSLTRSLCFLHVCGERLHVTAPLRAPPPGLSMPLNVEAQPQNNWRQWKVNYLQQAASRESPTSNTILTQEIHWNYFCNSGIIIQSYFWRTVCLPYWSLDLLPYWNWYHVPVQTSYKPLFSNTHEGHTQMEIPFGYTSGFRSTLFTMHFSALGVQELCKCLHLHVVG